MDGDPWLHLTVPGTGPVSAHQGWGRTCSNRQSGEGPASGYFQVINNILNNICCRIYLS